MPDNYQDNGMDALLSELGVDTSSEEDIEHGDDDTENPETDSEEGKQSENKNTETPETESKDDETLRRNNEAFAAMRTEAKKYKDFIKTMMLGSNYQGSEEDFIKGMTDAAQQRQAQRQGVSPEVLQRMNALESQNREILEERNKELFASNLKNLESTLKLDRKDINEFMEYAAKEHIDLTIPGTNFVTLYQGLFFNKLMDRRIEEARQEWIAQGNKANNAANPDGKSGKKDPTPTDVNTMAEFDSLLKSIPNK